MQYRRAGKSRTAYLWDRFSAAGSRSDDLVGMGISLRAALGNRRCVRGDGSLFDLRGPSRVVRRAGDGDQNADVKGQRSEVRSQRSEVRSQKSEVRSQKSEVRSQRSEVRGQRSEVRGQKSEVRGQKSKVRGQKSEIPGERPTSHH